VQGLEFKPQYHKNKRERERERERERKRETCIHMFIAALFTLAKI
jgi:hypothetical protein